MSKEEMPKRPKRKTDKINRYRPRVRTYEGKLRKEFLMPEEMFGIAGMDEILEEMDR